MTRLTETHQKSVSSHIKQMVCTFCNSANEQDWGSCQTAGRNSTIVVTLIRQAGEPRMGKCVPINTKTATALSKPGRRSGCDSPARYWVLIKLSRVTTVCPNLPTIHTFGEQHCKFLSRKDYFAVHYSYSISRTDAIHSLHTTALIPLAVFLQASFQTFIRPLCTMMRGWHR